MLPGSKRTKKGKVSAAAVTATQEVEVLTPAECAEFIDTVEVSQAQIDAGNFRENESEALEAWLLDANHGDSKST